MAPPRPAKRARSRRLGHRPLSSPAAFASARRPCAAPCARGPSASKGLPRDLYQSPYLHHKLLGFSGGLPHSLTARSKWYTVSISCAPATALLEMSAATLSRRAAFARQRNVPHRDRATRPHAPHRQARIPTRGCAASTSTQLHFHTAALHASHQLLRRPSLPPPQRTRRQDPQPIVKQKDKMGVFLSSASGFAVAATAATAPSPSPAALFPSPLIPRALSLPRTPSRLDPAPFS